ncbi:hypothetical protein [Pseudoclavibacter sp. RFBA6]|uniref:hypothetical protein n=1 Tax=Pseudoclavibacter sp. RFBA6 TaxID=2080573 RepID=UPI000CE8A548|nr:hypothetical protein [Pseudoclavibacter sp. RFBA6]PPG39275.1 hypothetical protein C5C17_10735 [Pseudoclavibacter sp. RFBA6]
MATISTAGRSRLMLGLARHGLGLGLGFGFGETRYRWCGAERDWSAESTLRFDAADLRPQTGGSGALSLAESMSAFRDAGAEVSMASRFTSGRNRSFSVAVSAGSDECVLASSV